MNCPLTSDVTLFLIMPDRNALKDTEATNHNVEPSRKVGKSDNLLGKRVYIFQDWKIVK